MTNKYVMTRQEWIDEVVSLLPDVYTNKVDVAEDLSIDFGIISGLLQSGWYPSEALDIFLDKECDQDRIDESDFEEYAEKLKAFNKKQEDEYNSKKFDQ